MGKREEPERPCPFCGGQPMVVEAMSEYWVRCAKCDASTKMSSKRSVAVRAWDRRTDGA